MSFKDSIVNTAAGEKIWQQERTILETTEMICGLMKSGHVSRSELATRLNVTRGYVTQLLDGTANMTLRTASDIFVALGYRFHPSKSPLVDDSREFGDEPALRPTWASMPIQWQFPRIASGSMSIGTMSVTEVSGPPFVPSDILKSDRGV